MSYSACLFCKEQVRAYEKYCNPCVYREKLKNDLTFWKRNGFEFYQEPKRTEEIRLDQLAAIIQKAPKP